jgi:hypothetical protein
MITYNLTKAFATWAYEKSKSAKGKERVFLRALSCLPGKTAVETVKTANSHSSQRVTTDEFRKWLPGFLSLFLQEGLKNE